MPTHSSAGRTAGLIEALRARGVASAAELALALGVSQPTVSRTLAALRPRVVALGRGRAARYALAHTLGRLGGCWPLHRLDAEARPRLLGHLQALAGGRFHFTAEGGLPAFLHGEFRHGRFPGLPWFLDDQRPQGFLGRAFAHRVAPGLGIHADLAHWGADDIVSALLTHGEDQPGDLLLGDAMLERAMAHVLQPEDILDSGDLGTQYARRAEAALRGEAVGSSAAGEQPKFTATLPTRESEDVRPVLVKFSERITAAGGARWADLLRCEHLAAVVLQGHGHAAAHRALIEGDGRLFLQVDRFDRTAAGGRRGFVSLAALDAAFYGHGRIDWWHFAPQLVRDGWLTEQDARRLGVYGWFGALIGNTDMHLGNAGCVLADARPLLLAPSYDMLPMLWRPSAQGEVVAREFQPALPTPAQQPLWREAAAMAVEFWERTASGMAWSPEFRAIAATAAGKVQAALRRFG